MNNQTIQYAGIAITFIAVWNTHSMVHSLAQDIPQDWIITVGCVSRINYCHLGWVTAAAVLQRCTWQHLQNH